MLLGIDTSGTVSVAIGREGSAPEGTEILAVLGEERARHHDEVLLGMIDAALREAGIQRGDLTGIVAGRGPGPFTGLRVGLVVARTLGAILDVPVEGVCSLDALAHEAAADVITAAHPASADATSDARPDLTVAVALDARRREVYHARYLAGPGRLERTDGPAVDAPAEVADALRACDRLVGSGAELYPELLPATARLAHVDAGHLLRVAALQRRTGEDLGSTDPLYLREPDAAKPTARKSALGLAPR